MVSKVMSISLTPDFIEDLNKIAKKTRLGKSKLVRMFIEYFSKNHDELQKLLEGDYGFN